jgi:hypothetical protein
MRPWTGYQVASLVSVDRPDTYDVIVSGRRQPSRTTGSIFGAQVVAESLCRELPLATVIIIERRDHEPTGRTWTMRAGRWTKEVAP